MNISTLICSCARLIHVKTPERVGLQTNPFIVHVDRDTLENCVKVNKTFLIKKNLLSHPLFQSR